MNGHASTDLLEFGSDLRLRSRWFSRASFSHPAKLHLGFLQWLITRYTQPGETIADPMAGMGGILFAATLQRHVIAREIESHWLELMAENAVSIRMRAGLFAGEIDVGQADAREPWGYTADHVLFSPPYANATSATPTAHKLLPYGERWTRLIQTPTPGAMGAVIFHYGTHPAQIGHLRGERYWQAMRAVYEHAFQALRPSGTLILIVKDHIRNGQRVPTVQTTIAVCEALGFRLHAHHQRRVSPLSLWQRRRKEAGFPVVEEEDALVFTKRMPP